MPEWPQAHGEEHEKESDQQWKEQYINAFRSFEFTEDSVNDGLRFLSLTNYSDVAEQLCTQEKEVQEVRLFEELKDLLRLRQIQIDDLLQGHSSNAHDITQYQEQIRILQELLKGWEWQQEELEQKVDALQASLVNKLQKHKCSLVENKNTVERIYQDFISGIEQMMASNAEVSVLDLKAETSSQIQQLHHRAIEQILVSIQTDEKLIDLVQASYITNNLLSLNEVVGTYNIMIDVVETQIETSLKDTQLLLKNLEEKLNGIYLKYQ